MTVTVLSTSHSLVHHQSVVNRPVVVGGVGTGKQLECGENGSVFERHSKTVTSLFFSFFSDNAMSLPLCPNQWMDGWMELILY